MERRARRTFVIDSDVSEKINEASGGHPIEVNLLVNKALRRYLDWGRFADSFKLVVSDPRLMRTLWSHVSIDAARQMGAHNGNDTVVEFILYYFRKFDLETVLKTFKVIGGEYSNSFVYSEFGENHTRTVILRHGMGSRASAFYGASIRALCDRLGLTVDVEETDDSIICKIRGADVVRSTTPMKIRDQLDRKVA